MCILLVVLFSKQEHCHGNSRCRAVCLQGEGMRGREREGDSRCLEWESNCHDTIVNSTVYSKTPAAVGTTILFHSQTSV